jgi:hypothetical protein
MVTIHPGTGEGLPSVAYSSYRARLMDTSSSLPPKRGLGPVAWIGIGCGGIIALIVIGIAIFTMMYGGKIKQFAQEAQANPTRAAASAAVTFGGGQMEMIAQDDTNKRYTLREKQNGKLITIYWNEKKQAPETIEGDFSAIPQDPSTPPDQSAPDQPAPDQPAPDAPVPAPEPAPAAKAE